jgi:hypothetical protein
MTRIGMFTASLLGSEGHHTLLPLSAKFVEEGYPVGIVRGNVVRIVSRCIIAWQHEHRRYWNGSVWRR